MRKIFWIWEYFLPACSGHPGPLAGLFSPESLCINISVRRTRGLSAEWPRCICFSALAVLSHLWRTLLVIISWYFFTSCELSFNNHTAATGGQINVKPLAVLYFIPVSRPVYLLHLAHISGDTVSLIIPKCQYFQVQIVEKASRQFCWALFDNRLNPSPLPPPTIHWPGGISANASQWFSIS